MTEVVQLLHMAMQRYTLNIQFVRSFFPVFVAATVNPEHMAEFRHRIPAQQTSRPQGLGFCDAVSGYARPVSRIPGNVPWHYR